MEKGIINSSKKTIPYLIHKNNNKQKKMIIFFHGLDGTAASVKPIVKALGNEFTIVSIEQRGHMMSPMKAARSVKTHIDDYETTIKHFLNLGWKIWLMGESMGAAYCTKLAYRSKLDIQGIFAMSIPNKLVNIMNTSKYHQLKIQFITVICFFIPFLNYKYKADLPYESLSNNKTLIRISNMESITKIRQVKETLSTWATNKVAWRLLKSKSKPRIPFYYFHGQNDILVNFEKIDKAFKGKKQTKLLVVPNAKHILSWEKEASVVWEKVLLVTKKKINYKK